MRKIFTLFLAISVLSAQSQLLTWAPQFPSDASSITITVDATKGNKGLMDYSGPVYMHFGVITNLSTSQTEWKYVPTTWGTTTAPTATPAGTNKWSFTINNPRAYFGVPANETILRIALLFRDATGSKVQKNADGSDMYVPVYPADKKGIQFTQPFIIPTYSLTHEDIKAGIGTPVPVSAVASGSDGILNLYFNGAKINGPVSGNTTISGSAAPSVKGNQEFIAEYISGGISYYDTVNYYITPDNTIAALPAGVKEGINYDPNCTSATLVLYAPQKNNVVIVGDFPGSAWAPKAEFQMNKTPDGNYYWLTINNLVAGTEYAFNYRVDDSIYVADPYTEKVLDPYNDQYISNATYPNLKVYPSNHNVSASKNGIMSVLQSCQPAYNWQVTSFAKPDRKNLITYELLVRDFGDARNYQMLIDTISYFKRLGINSIELMPVNEFSGNDSWGYNPTFYCALDKAYGTKNKFKEFIDLCHQNGIAVILDVVYNHLDAGATPQGKMYWSNGGPAANSPWFNMTAPHPYSVFNDLNHTSAATQYLVERALEYWLTEYKIDGYRLDLGKGFTQTPSNGTTVENYDASRVANLERYYDYVISRFPDTYMIIEFLGQQRQEEQEYANHGFMLWGNNNPAYNQATMGYDNSNFSKIVYNSSEEAFAAPAEIGYMESHDEERLMYKNEQYGNSAGGYNVKDIPTALERNAAAAALFFTIPGPKMIWQFGERGYDISINANGGRVNAKPPHWEYMQDPNRLKLWDVYSKLIHFRLQNPAVFNSTNFTYDFYDNNGLFKRFQIADPDVNGMKVTVVANFDVVPQTRTVTFQSSGTWYSFLSNGTGSGLNGPTGSNVNILTATQAITLQPGEYHVYSDRQVVLPVKLLSFRGRRTSENISLAWQTSNEINVQQYVLERSFDAVAFKPIAALDPKNSADIQAVYSYTDNDVQAVTSDKKIYYRLKTTNRDGSYTYSNIAVINAATADSHLRIYPNPVKGQQVFVSLDEPIQLALRLKIEDGSGRLYKNYVLPASTSNKAIPVDIKNLSAGTYILKVESGKKVHVQQLIISR